MAGFAPRRVGHPVRSVVTVAELLGRAEQPLREEPGAHAALPVSALLRREGYSCDLAVRSVGPRADRTFAGLDIPRRHVAASAGAVLAVGSLAGAAIMLSDAAPQATNSDARDGGYPGRDVPTQPGPPGWAGAGGLAIPLGQVSFPSPLGPAGMASAALGSGAVSSGPVGSGPVGTDPVARASSGGPVGGSVGGAVEALGDTVSHAPSTLGSPVGTVSAEPGVSRGARTMPTAGSALSSLTKPIAAGDAGHGSHSSKRSGTGGSLPKVLSGVSHGSSGSKGSSAGGHGHSRGGHVGGPLG